MTNKKLVKIVFVSVIVLSLISLSLSTAEAYTWDPTQKQTNYWSSKSQSSPSPNPSGTATNTATPNVNNLAPFPNGWVTDSPYGTQLPASNIYHDTTTTHNSAYTFRVDPTTGSNSGGDHWISVSPGDHIVMKCWIKTSGAKAGFVGGRIGMDIGGSANGLATVDVGGAASAYEVTNGFTDVAWEWGGITGSAYSESQLEANYVPWGTDWTLKTWDFIVPSTVLVQPGYQSTYPAGSSVHVTSIGVWFQINPYSGSSSHSAWFSDFQVYRNP